MFGVLKLNTKSVFGFFIRFFIAFVIAIFTINASKVALIINSHFGWKLNSMFILVFISAPIYFLYLKCFYKKK
jgi:uncharacterized RDD family membrane protein YckC